MAIAIMMTISINYCTANADDIKTGNVIFIHPDGSGPSLWAAMRIYNYGPDNLTNWDRMEKMGLYRSHILNSTNSGSHPGATIHAYGVKVDYDTYGNAPEKPVGSLSGKNISIMMEAKEAGMATAIINSGHICEPGTGVFVASSANRNWRDLITIQIMESGVDIIFAGGEKYLLPKGVIGHHGKDGKRKDGKNLIKQAEQLGYTIVYNRDELLALPSDVDKALGVFASKHTFNDKSEEKLKQANLPLYNQSAPTLAEMTETALRILEYKNRQFFMVVEEEGSDNFGNSNNAEGILESIKRADDAIGVAMNYIQRDPNTLLLTAADSDAGGIQVYSVRKPDDFDKPLPDTTKNGGPLDGRHGKNSLPFIAAPDKHGTRLRFGIVWACYNDVAGAIIARAHGLNSDLLKNNLDNTDIYRIMYATLFGKMLPAYNPLLE
ncbi:MAG: alkaline phosphatase [candidate division Zixibacteria bacterium]|nr:alkaline phosphatase [candidate division Zixibacteria bacterium]